MTFYINSGRNELRISTAIPDTNTTIVLREQPFHSLRIMPHTFENVTFKAIRMQKESVSIALPLSKKLRPSDSPKNWLYHRRPASAQNRRLFPHTLQFL